MIRIPLNKFTFLLLLYLFTQRAFALPADHEASLNIVADAVSMNYAKNMTILHGNVTITQGSTELEGATVMLYLDAKQQLIKLIAEGDEKKQAKYTTLPEKNKPFFVATANKITYFNQEELAIFEGDAHATSGCNYFQGPNFKYWTEKQEVSTEESPNQHATILIVPESS